MLSSTPTEHVVKDFSTTLISTRTDHVVKESGCFNVNVDAAFCPVTTRGAAGVATWEMGSFQSLMPRLNVFILSRII
jgi:hypothetical protein